MKKKLMIAATVVAAAFAVGNSAPASAYPKIPAYKLCKWFPKKCPPSPPQSSSTGKFVVGCIMGSAAGLIYASVVKGGGIKYMSQKEWEDLKVKVPNPLTNDEAGLIAGTCGLAAFLVKPATAPTVVRAGG
jgi:hypothetical protein